MAPPAGTRPRPMLFTLNVLAAEYWVSSWSSAVSPCTCSPSASHCCKRRRASAPSPPPPPPAGWAAVLPRSARRHRTARACRRHRPARRCARTTGRRRRHGDRRRNRDHRLRHCHRTTATTRARPPPRVNASARALAVAGSPVGALGAALLVLSLGGVRSVFFMLAVLGVLNAVAAAAVLRSRRRQSSGERA